LRPATRAAISVVIVAILTIALLGSFRRDVIADRLWRIGFQQSWDVYAPDPVKSEQTFAAIITYTDGSQSTWRVPRAGALFPYPSHRWERWQDGISYDSANRWWEPAARWIAREHAKPGKVAARVVLRRRWAQVPPPGTRARRTWTTVDFYTLPLR